MKPTSSSTSDSQTFDTRQAKAATLHTVIKLGKRLIHGSNTSAMQDEEKLAAINLLESYSFRLNSSMQHDKGLGFRMMKAAVVRALRAPAHSIDLSSVDGIIISSSSCDHANVKHYVGSMSGKSNLAYIIKDQLSFRGEYSIGEWLKWLVFSLRQSVRVFFGKRKINNALTIIEVLEIGVLLKWLKRHNLQSIYDFVPFEVDSNFLYLCTKNLAAHTTKIPSPGPLSSHNKIVLCDELILSGGYHFEELNALAHQYRVSQYTSWPPERAHTYYDLYTKTAHNTSPLALAFYSHGEWIRMEKGLVEKTSPLLSAEQNTLQFLGKFLQEFPQYHLTIYPHPKERKGKTMEELYEHYRNITGCEHIRIAPAGKATTLHFHEADLAVTCFSTIIFERLYCGFKTLIQRIDEHDFPKPGSVLNTICFQNYEQLRALIIASSAISASDFFESHQLEKYLHRNFPAPIAKHA